jgi:hypothetical protein
MGEERKDKVTEGEREKGREEDFRGERNTEKRGRERERRRKKREEET